MDRHVICTEALGYLGARSIQSFHDGTNDGELCARFYEPTVRELLSSHPWNFAEWRERLGADARAAGPDYAYSYEVPRDFIGARHLLDTNGYARQYGYRIVGSRILADEATPYLVYTRRAAEQDFPPLFSKALAYAMASKLAGPITGDPTLIEHFMALADATLRRARLADSQQDTPQVIHSDILTAWHTG